MRQKSGSVREPAEQVVKNIRRATRRHFSAEEKIRVVLEGLRGEDSIAELCRREGIGSTFGSPPGLPGGGIYLQHCRCRRLLIRWIDGR
jgi:transposase